MTTGEEGRRCIMEEQLNRFRKLLKERGLKTTSQRMAILKVLLDQPDSHLTAEEIYDLVKKDWPDIGLATVYRNIQLLSEMNLIDKLNLDDGYVRYEIGDQNQQSHHHHHHMICISCGKVFAFQEDLLDNLEQKIEQTTGFVVSDHEVKLYGRCAQCLAKGGVKSE